MKLAKTAAKRVLKATLGPEGTLKFMRRYGDSKTLMQCWLSPRYWESVRRLRLFKNKHKGQRCFIVGNGPSLKEMDLAPLRNEFTFGLNRIYLLFESLGFATTYFVSLPEVYWLECTAAYPCHLRHDIYPLKDKLKISHGHPKRGSI